MYIIIIINHPPVSSHLDVCLSCLETNLLLARGSGVVFMMMSYLPHHYQHSVENLRYICFIFVFFSVVVLVVILFRTHQKCKVM